MCKVRATFGCLFLGFSFWANAQSSDQLKKNTIIEAVVQDADENKGLSLTLEPTNSVDYLASASQVKKGQAEKGLVKWKLPITKALYLRNDVLFNDPTVFLPFIEPGDSIRIHYKGKAKLFSGRGALKFQLIQKIEAIDDSLRKTAEFKQLSSKWASPSSLADYFGWHNFLNKKLELLLPFIENNQRNLSEFSYITLKSFLLKNIERLRTSKFNFLRRNNELKAVNQYGLSNQDLCLIYDSTQNGVAAKWLRYKVPFITSSLLYSWERLHLQDYRDRGRFFRTSPADTPILGKEEEDIYILQYNRAKKEYKGVIREELMAFTFYFSDGVIHETGFTPRVEALLQDYYAQPGFPEFKKTVRNYEMKQRQKWNREYSQDFSLMDAKGNPFSNEQLKGKIAIIDFWFTGCKGCVQMAPALRKVEGTFKNDSNVVFLSVSIDKDREQWLKSIQGKLYTTGGGIQAYTNGLGKNHAMITKFFVESYPTLEMIDTKGRFYNYDRRQIDPRRDGGKAMITFIQKQLSTLKDGPYVFHTADTITAYSVNGKQLSATSFITGNSPVFSVQTDSSNTFPVQLKPALSNEPAEFSRPKKMLVLSDIEGNFDTFRKLLQANQVIDRNFQWKFGNGHLVLAGDMFDRGRQVTECLWLVYALEEQAKKVGGYVHFILGNHEIMNLQGDDRYVEYKYKDNAALMDKKLKELYSSNSELGRWLRTKNIAEKIGDLLFVHGGISRKLNTLPVTIDEINTLARPYYAERKENYGNETVNTIMSTQTGPFWYRTYYKGKTEMPQVIDSTLEKFGVNHIVTGHTIVADTISVHYGGKVINTDTHHAEGKSEALLIEKDTYYRVNTMGQKILLFAEPWKYSASVTKN